MPPTTAATTQPAATTNGQEPVGVAMIPIEKIRENQVALRAVDRESEAYLELVDSIKQKGVLNAIVVREIDDPEHPGQKLYGLIDGLHRWTAAQDAGLKEIPATIRKADQAEVEEMQIVANVHKIETKPVEYTKQLERLMTRNPLMTVGELAKKLAKSPEWLNQRFGLLKLKDEIAAVVDEGRVGLANAYQLAKLPKEEQDAFLERAMTMAPDEFGATVSARVKEIRDARRQGREANPPEFKPVAFARKWSEIKAEYDAPKIGPALIQESGVKTPEDAFKLAVAWAANMDPRSQAAQKEKHDSQIKEREEAKKKRAADRAKKQQEEAAETLAKLRQEGVEPSPEAVEAAAAAK